MQGEKGFSARIFRKGLLRIINADLRSITAESCRCERDVLVNVLDKSRMASLDGRAVWISVPLVVTDHRTERQGALPPLPGAVAEVCGGA
jgi:hypothetical protein